MRRCVPTAFVLVIVSCFALSSAYQARAVAPPLSQAARNQLVAKRIKHVFVIYQENRSFDNEFGTFPGAEGVWSAAARAHGFYQRVDPLSPVVTPFRITDPDVYYESNARAVLTAAFNHGNMDNFVATQAKVLREGDAAQRASVGAETMYHIDCDTIPFTWAFAARFALFDNFYQALRSPSTPSNVEIIAAQNGLTQYARHPKLLPRHVDLPGDPIFVDLGPAFGPYSLTERVRPDHQINQTYATVLLAMERKRVQAVVNDNEDVRKDQAVIARLGDRAIPWHWYQEGYTTPRHAGFIAHHAAPQYFGYIVKNESMHNQMRDLSTFYSDLTLNRLPDRGLFYLKGGSQNVLGLHPANKDSFVQQTYGGDDDHPGYSDQQVSEALVASLVGAIARSPYWKDSAIVITWDDSGGYWDHVPPHDFERCPDGNPCGDGERVPAIVISPYAKSGAIVHALSDQDSVLKFVETVFGLPALASLPDERPYLPLGPRDGNPLLSNLTAAFDDDRLAGTKAPILPDAATFAETTVRTIPPPVTCADIGVTPATPPPGISDSPPPAFMPRPFASPSFDKLRMTTAKGHI